MTILNETAPPAGRVNLEFVLQQLAALEPTPLPVEDASCNGCNHCSVSDPFDPGS